MAAVTWDVKIFQFRGPFLSEEALETQSYVHRLLSGAEKWDDAEDVEHGLPLYDEQIAQIRHQYDAERNEVEEMKRDLVDLSNRVVGETVDVFRQMAESQQQQQLWVPKFWRPVPFPHFSSWQKEQQQFVVDQMVKYWATGIPTDPNSEQAGEVRKLMALVEKMRVEQEEFFSFVRQVNKSQLMRYNFIDGHARGYMHRRMLMKGRCVRDYPAHYKEVKLVALAPTEVAPLDFVPLGQPLELGTTPVMVIPDMTKSIDLKKQMSFLESFFPTSRCYPRQKDVGYKHQDGTYLYKTPVSSDPNVSRLASSLDFGFVATPSVLKTLLDNASPWERQWEVPVTVREVACRQAGGTRRVVFLDKPLPPHSLNSIERNAMVHKRTMRILTCKQHTGAGPADYSIWRPGDKRTVSETTHGGDETPKKKKPKKQKSKKKKLQRARTASGSVRPQAASPPATAADPAEPADTADSEPASGDEGLLVDELVGGDEDEPISGLGGHLLNAGSDEATAGVSPAVASAAVAASAIRQPMTTFPSTSPTSPGPSPAFPGPSPASPGPSPASPGPSPASPGPGQTTVAGAGDRESADSGPKTDPSLLYPPPGLNVNYRVWRLGSVQLLLRSTTHGMQENPTLGRLVQYTVHAKPAYQPAYGIEVVTRAELVRQWVDCLVRPGSRVLRVHFEPASKIVIFPEERTFKQLTDELFKYNTRFQPKEGLQVLESILRELGDLAPGRYLLQHDSRAGAFVRLSQATDSASDGFNLHLSFQRAPKEVVLSEPPCLSIDPSVLAPYNLRYGRVPATFDYDWRPRGQLSWKDYWKKRKEDGQSDRKRVNRNRLKLAQKNEALGEPPAFATSE